jgi:hypothetical protein
VSAAVADAATAARTELDRVEKELKPGHGKADLFWFARKDADAFIAGAGAEAAHRVNAKVSIFARGWIGSAWDRAQGRTTEGEVLGGIRASW